MEYFIVLLLSFLLSSAIVGIITSLLIIAAKDDFDIYIKLGLCISIIISTIIIYIIIIDNYIIQVYANKYGCIYRIQYDNKKIYTTSIKMSGEDIIIDDVNGDHYEINKDKQSYTIIFCKSNDIKE